ncbi:DUF924 family protein [Phreatobacter sp.]|uniref:DUF924 family protein n=1 Tax=Phreatobacter sp. TaxID=1966341 RepID=UPI0022C87556|nr:DUF924 family protein [Phreatobacter sp.]MCZ8314631.1 DUF924 family protein [Phreatobacter sp.]
MTATTALPAAAEVVAFWREAGEDAWFTKDEAFDARFRERFWEAHFAAARRALDGFMASPEGALALMILLDQFPRNAFRGTGHMYATDPLALSFAGIADKRGDAAHVDPALRVFLSLPYSHSEVLADQDRAVDLTRAIGGDTHAHAIGHRDVIARFGRFPHRNAMLGRTTTAEEHAFLDGGGFAG